MKITDEEKQKLEELYQHYLHHYLILQMKDIPMHFGSNCYNHSFRVAKVCIHRAIRSRKKYDLEALLVAAILHDYYLYDWREDRDIKKKHGRRHPLVAAENAKRDFNISKKIQDIIKSHMWPLTPRQFPKTREAKMLNYVDDVIATREFMTNTKHKKKNAQKYAKMIEHLFDK